MFSDSPNSTPMFRCRAKCVEFNKLSADKTPKPMFFVTFSEKRLFIMDID